METKRRFAQFGYRLGVFLDGQMQGVTTRENLPSRHEAFQFRCGHAFDCRRIICQFTENLPGYPLGFRFVGKFF
jgi:hypothetical protein